MSTTPFPTSLSQLHVSDTTIAPNLYTTLKQLKKSTLSLHNRLRSILTDAAYTSDTVHAAFPTWPLIANERCGSWYIPPRLKGGSAYFKSTDGHYGYWDFSLRRLNLQVLELLGRHGGAVLVDSTRRGKRMPDALRRTVPVWVVVWNRVLFGARFGRGQGWEWAFELQHPELEPGEVRLIEARIYGWTEGLKGLGLDLESLREKVKKPIRLSWIVQGEDLPQLNGNEVNTRENEYNSFVLCSASRRVLGAEMSEDGYIQGAADDAEGWSGGLTSAIFWEHQDRLMATAEEDLPELMTSLIEEGKTVGGQVETIQVKPTRNIFVVSAPSAMEDVRAAGFDLVLDCDAEPAADGARVVSLGCRSGKLGSRDLREKLSVALASASKVLEKNADNKILIVCKSGKDLSVGVAVAILCLLYDDEGRLTASSSVNVDKQLVKKRLAWITSVKPDANPSRSTLQAVNSFLMR